MPKSSPTTTARRTARNAASAGSSTWSSLAHDNAGNTLTIERIVAAGISIADREGLEALSIRRIAADLRSSPMSLYHYVPSKRDLLNLMLDAVNADFRPPTGPVRGWCDVLLHFASESRRYLKTHPWVSVLRAGHPEYGPESIRILEWLLTSLAECGLEAKTAARTLGVLYVFVNGFVAEEAASRGQRAHFSKTVLATGKFPKVARFAAEYTEAPDDEGFNRALSWILNGIAADIDKQGPGKFNTKDKKVT